LPARGESAGQWLAGEVHHRGIRENAAVLAVLEIPDYRHHAAQSYALDHPGRPQALEDMLAALLRVRHPPMHEEEATGWMGFNLAASSPDARGRYKPRAGTRGHGVAVFPARPPQPFGGLGQLGAVAVG
jgi:hypothetical protein